MVWQPSWILQRYFLHLILEGLLTEDIEKINQYLSSLEPEEAEYQANLAVKAGFISFQEEPEEK